MVALPVVPRGQGRHANGLVLELPELQAECVGAGPAPRPWNDSQVASVLGSPMASRGRRPCLRARHLPCQRCLSAHAGFTYHGRWRSDLDHDLCMRCWRSIRNSQRAHRLRGRRRARIAELLTRWAEVVGNDATQLLADQGGGEP